MYRLELCDYQICDPLLQGVLQGLDLYRMLSLKILHILLSPSLQEPVQNLHLSQGLFIMLLLSLYFLMLQIQLML